MCSPQIGLIYPSTYIAIFLSGSLVARPLFQLSISAKVAAISLGLFAVIYPILCDFLVSGMIPLSEITDYSTFMLLVWVGAFAMGVYCRGESIKNCNCAEWDDTGRWGEIIFFV